MKTIFLCVMVLVCAFCHSNATVSMTLNTPGGLVIAADSRETYQANGITRISSEYAQKITQVGNGVAVTYAGNARLADSAGNLLDINSLVLLFERKYGITESTKTYPEIVAHALDSFMYKLCIANPLNFVLGQLTINISGFTQKGTAYIYGVGFPPAIDNSKGQLTFKPRIDSSSAFQSLVLGQGDVYCRLVKGYDPALETAECFKLGTLAMFADSGKRVIVDSTFKKNQVIDHRAVRYDVRYDLMTMQDAIDFCVFIVRATIEAQRFNQSTIQGVGGAIDIAVITPDGFRWIQHKELCGESVTFGR